MPHDVVCRRCFEQGWVRVVRSSNRSNSLAVCCSGVGISVAALLTRTGGSLFCAADINAPAKKDCYRCLFFKIACAM